MTVEPMSPEMIDRQIEDEQIMLQYYMNAWKHSGHTRQHLLDRANVHRQNIKELQLLKLLEIPHDE